MICRTLINIKKTILISLWESYYSFANSNGGVIILGVGERQDGTWYTTGLKNVDKLKRNFWNIIHDTFNNLPDEEYLERIGAAGYGEDGKLHPTTAGLLMFGEEYHIVREFPEYFLDYREMLDPTIRWTDRRQSSSGDWSGNMFDFFFRVNSKIAKDIKKPFKFEGITRVDDTPVHKAVREALVNCLVNTDYFLPCGVVIKKEEDKLVMDNPGSIRTGKKQMLRGGISDPRNKTLMKMFKNK